MTAHITIALPDQLKKALMDYLNSIPLPPGAKRSASSYVNNAIIEQLKRDGVIIPPYPPTPTPTV